MVYVSTTRSCTKEYIPMYKFSLCVTQLLSAVVIRPLYSNFMLESIRNIYIFVWFFVFVVCSVVLTII